jgi:hypothetical protein
MEACDGQDEHRAGFLARLRLLHPRKLSHPPTLGRFSPLRTPALDLRPAGAAARGRVLWRLGSKISRRKRPNRLDPLPDGRLVRLAVLAD